MPPDKSKSGASGLLLLTGSTTARLLGSTTAGFLELIIFHPVDTVAKRLMTNRNNIHGPHLQATLSNLSKVVFRDAYQEPILRRYTSLFPGLGFAAAYKILQRIYKFGGQPIVKDYLTRHHSEFFVSAFGTKSSKTMMHATAGSMIGVGEIILLPLDILKIRAQTNPEALAGKGVVSIFRTEGYSLYRGWGWTAARNAPGSFALFGGSAACKEYLFKLENFNDATFFQNFICSVAGASASVFVAQPLDVIKTRVQSRSFSSPINGWKIAQNLIAEEGIGALFKGLVPKLSVVGPKLVFSFTIAQHLIALLENSFAK